MNCVVCQRDVSEGKRVKDIKGNYYCGDCWSARNQTSGKVVSRATPPPPPPQAAAEAEPTYRCRACHGTFGLSFVYSEPDGRIICKDCFAAARSTPAAKQKASPPVDASAPAEGLELLDPIDDDAAAPLANVDPDSLFTRGMEFDAAHSTPTAKPGQGEPQRRKDEFFCEDCSMIFAPNELFRQPDKSIICKACIKKRRLAAKEAQRLAEKMARISDKKR